MSCHCRTMPRWPLLIRTTTIGSCSSTDVASSCCVIWKQPSPSTQITVASGRAAFAPIAPGGQALERLEHRLRLHLVATLAVAKRGLLAPASQLSEPGLGGVRAAEL